MLGKEAKKQMRHPLITVITATLNGGDKLKVTFDSILAQRCKDVEYILIDGLSTDNTMEIIRDYHKKFSGRDITFKCISEKDSGIYDAFNKGIHMASGRYLIFMGAGDYFFPNIFHKMKNTLETERYDFIYGNVYNKSNGTIYDGKFDIYKIMVGNISHQAIFYKADLFKRLGKYELKYKILSDYHFNLKCFSPESKLSIKYVKYIISVFEGAGLSAFNPDTDFLEDLPILIRQNFGDTGLAYFENEKPKKDKQVIRTFLDQMLAQKAIGVKDKFVIYGTANWGQRFYDGLKEKELDVLAFSDSNSEKWGIKFNDIEVISPDKIENTEYDKIIIASGRWAEIREILASKGYADEKILFMKTM